MVKMYLQREHRIEMGGKVGGTLIVFEQTKQVVKDKSMEDDGPRQDWAVREL
jgi:hypothetical protein